MKALLDSLPQTGRVEWIGLRPAKRADLNVVPEVEVTTKEGLVGDRYGGRSGNRQVTLIQAEHLEVVAKLLNIKRAEPSLARRNIIVSGINLLAFSKRQFQIGESVILEMTGICHPCSRMEENYGPGGYNAMRGHSGINARVIQGGRIRVGDAVNLLPQTTVLED
ncbi:MAG: MOSC domain-containing protein [Bacteroidota bacterium]